MKRWFSILVIVSVYFITSCSEALIDEVQSAKSSLTDINIEIYEGTRIMFENFNIKYDNLQQVVSNRIEELKLQGINKQDVVLNLKVTKSTNIDFIYDLQIELRDLGIRKIKYSLVTLDSNNNKSLIPFILVER